MFGEINLVEYTIKLGDLLLRFFSINSRQTDTRYHSYVFCFEGLGEVGMIKIVFVLRFHLILEFDSKIISQQDFIEHPHDSVLSVSLAV